MAEAEVEKEVKKSAKDALSDVFDEREIVGQEKKERPRRRRRMLVDLKCPLCEAGAKDVSYRDVYQLKKYTSVRGKIIGRDKSGMCASHQRQLSTAIKQARYMALLPYVSLSEPAAK